MRTCLLLLLCLILLALGLLACGPSSDDGKGLSRRGSTAGICPSCGGTNLDVESTTERSSYDGSPIEYLDLTCRDCGHTWRVPGGMG